MSDNNENRIRVYKVIKYIEQNVDQNLPLEKLADLASFSPFHFQRVFKYIVGETPKQYIQRVRLERASHYIALKSETSLLEVALFCGFNSLEAFSRAFKNYYEVSPDEFRKSREEVRLSIISKKTNSGNHSIIEPSSFLSTSVVEEEFEDFQVEIIKLPAIKLIYIPLTLSKIETLLSGFKKVKQWAMAKELIKTDSKPFGLMLNYPMFTALEKCRFFACIEVNKEPEVSGEINFMEIPSRTYATFLMKSGINEMIKSTTAFASLWLPESGFKIDHVPAIQVPIDDPLSEHFHEITYEFYIAIKPR